MKDAWRIEGSTVYVVATSNRRDWYLGYLANVKEEECFGTIYKIKLLVSGVDPYHSQNNSLIGQYYTLSGYNGMYDLYKKIK